ncbi:MAG TPA: GGDEF domain-containing protein [Clostridia bacterium]|nr:GGDEF domain-containing protein [Clostridia bacterium]
MKRVDKAQGFLVPGAQPQEIGVSEVVELIHGLLIDQKLPEQLAVGVELSENETFRTLVRYILDLRDLCLSLSRGELHHLVYGTGYILSNLKALQANLRHMTWQTQQIAGGDFTQRVDYMGDFSVAFNEMVVRLEYMTDQLQRLASLDNLTKANNRLSMESSMESLLMQVRAKSAEAGVILADIDLFKQVNDTHGHLMGDRVLVRVSQALRSAIRPTDMLVRYGGEEFLIVLAGTGLEKAGRIAQSAREAVERLQIETETEGILRVTISVGVSQMDPTDESVWQALNRCDQALYHAKNTGRNRVCVAFPGVNGTAEIADVSDPLPL